MRASALLRPLVAMLAAAALAVGLGAPAAAGVLRTAVGDTLTVMAPEEVAYGDQASVAGVLTDSSGTPVPGAVVLAEARRSDGGWVVVSAPGTTDAAGTVVLALQPTVSTVVRLRHDTVDGAVSAESVILVRARLTAALDRTEVRLGRRVTVAGTLAPVPEAAHVLLERRTPSGWQLTADVVVRPDGTWETAVAQESQGFQHYRVVRPGEAGVARAEAELGRLDVFRLYRYSVSTRGRLRADTERFRAGVADTYADRRGWVRAHLRFREVRRGGDFTVVLAQARYLPTYSGECSTTYSCRVGRNVIINQTRWRTGSPYFPGDLLTYRRMVVNHETGHWLGRGHAYCPGPGRPAPVMQQQSKGLNGCRVNPWPLPRELRRVR